MHTFLFLLLLLPIALFGNFPTEKEILESDRTPLTATFGMPSTNIFGVNVINGDYHYACIDFELPGADPLILQRTYCSSSFQARGLWEGWSHNLTSHLTCYTSDCNTYFHVVSTGPLSGEIPFRTLKVNQTEPIKVSREIYKKGVSNCGSKEISGRTNIKNTSVSYKGVLNSREELSVTKGDGTQHLYQRAIDMQNSPRHYLMRTKKPNGSEVSYVTRGTILHNVKSLAKKDKISNQIDFWFPSNPEKIKTKKKPFTIKGTSDDGKQVKYSFKWHKTHSKSPDKNVLMSKFASNYLPGETYTYTDPNDGPEKLAARYGDQHKTLIQYYKKGDQVSVFDQNPEKVSKSHFARNRVKNISIAVNGSDDLQMAYQYAYHKNSATKEAYTDVLNEHNHLTRFHYSTKNYRLSSLEKFLNTSTVYLRERYEYGAKLSPLEGDLVCRTIENGNGIIHYGENYDYDERGNVVTKTQHFRTYTTQKPFYISNSDDCLKGGEVKEARYTYNSLNLPTSETNGKLTTTFSYCSSCGVETNLPKAILIQDENKILKRQFYEYDQNAGCILKIEDDGSKIDPNNLSRVKCRKILRMINREESFAGLPLEIDAWSSNGKEEHRLGRTTLEYDSHGYVEKEKHYDANNEFSYELTKIHDLQGNVISEINALGQTTTRQFNDYGCLLKEQGPALESCMEYSYDWLKRPIQETCCCIDGINLSISKSYDLQGHLTKIQDPYGFISEASYNEQGKPVEIVLPPVRVESGEWVTPRLYKEYNFLGYLISETNGNGGVTTYIPNDAGLPLRISYPDGTVEKFQYSIQGELLEKTHKNQSKTIFTYDSLSRVISEKTYDRDGNFLKEIGKKYKGAFLSSEIDGEGLKTKYSYDYAGRVSKIKKGKSLVENIYDSLGRIKEERRYFDQGEQDYIATIYTYDLLGRVLEETYKDSRGKLHSKTIKSYCENGEVESTTTHTHEGLAKTTYTYDPRGNLSSTTDALGNTTRFHHRYDFIYEGLNLPCTEVVDPTGVRTRTISDAHGSVICTKIYDPFGKTISETQFYYDLDKNVVRKEHHLPNEVIETLYKYDLASHLIQQINGADTLEKITTSFTYNRFGELTSTVYSDGSIKHQAYDALGRLSEEWSSDKSVHYKYTYNGQDLPITVLNCNTQKETIRSYSLEGNLLSEQFENGLKIAYKYDYMNRIKECIYPDGSSIKQTYNPKFLTKIERIIDGQIAYETRFQQFDGSGKPKLLVLPQNAGTLKVQYDRLCRPKSFEYKSYVEQKISYDERGLPTSKVVNDHLHIFKHNHLQQLTLEQTDLYSHKYKNDSLNRQTIVDGQKQSYNALHQLLEGIGNHYRYDKKGRRTSDSTTCYRYDPFDRLISIKKDKSTWSYTYDAFNRKMSRTFNGKTVYYFYNGLEEIGSFDDEEHSLDLKVISGKEGSLPIAIELESKPFSLIISAHGHIIGLVDIATGCMENFSPLTMYGKDLTATPLSPWRFCGKRHEDLELQLIDFGFRFYHPQSAQWLSPDPLGEVDGPNLYAYVKNSPANHVDRYGLLTGEYNFGPSPIASVSVFNNSTEYNFPQISYIDFESSRSVLSPEGNYSETGYDYSNRFDLTGYGRPELPNGNALGWINGVANRFEDSLSSALYISDLSGGYNVHGVYNATHGLTSDGWESILALSYMATDPVSRLHETWDLHFDTQGPTATILQIGHSQGQLHVRNALLDYPEERRNRIYSIGIAPAGYVYPDSCAQSINFRAPYYRDVITICDIAGAIRSRETTVCLKSHRDASWWDHSFQSPTYKEPLKDKIRYYIKHGELK